jgi:hypothetical protein
MPNAYICFMDTKQILILIGFAIYYFIRSSGKKNKEQQQRAAKQRPQNTPAPKPERSIEEILRDLAGETAPKVEKPKYKEVPKKEIVIESATENKPRREHKSEPFKTSQIAEDNDEVEFDLRQAIINDAILNRPHQ